MSNVIEFPSELLDALRTLERLYRDGKIRELIIYAPDARDADAFHFAATSRLELGDVLMAKHELSMLAAMLSEAAAAGPPGRGGAAA